VAKMGRPTKLTPKVMTDLCDAVETGANYVDVAASAKVSPEALNKWRAEGKEIFECVQAATEPVGLMPREMRLLTFYKRFTAAEGQGATNCATIVYNAAMKDPEWALRWLERRRGEDWGLRIKQEIEHSGEMQIVMGYVDVPNRTTETTPKTGAGKE